VNHISPINFKTVWWKHPEAKSPDCLAFRRRFNFFPKLRVSKVMIILVFPKDVRANDSSPRFVLIHVSPPKQTIGDFQSSGRERILDYSRLELRRQES
jgi:hypothetical protein